jgi:DNA repair protein RecO (recombination protein O)
MVRCPSTATRRSSCVPRSWARPTASSPCSPGASGRCGSSARGCGAPGPASAPGSSRACTSTSSATRVAASTRWQVETLDPWGDAIARDYPSWTAATAVLETCDRLTEERQPALQQYLLLTGAVRSLAGHEHDPNLVLDAYLLRALAVAGWAPSFHDCAKCGAQGPHGGFHVVAGGAVCPACRPPGSAAPAPETLLLLAALLAGDWTVADASSIRHRREGSGLTAAFLQWHLERGIRSLRMVER